MHRKLGNNFPYIIPINKILIYNNIIEQFHGRNTHHVLGKYLGSRTTVNHFVYIVRRELSDPSSIDTRLLGLGPELAQINLQIAFIQHYIYLSTKYRKSIHILGIYRSISYVPYNSYIRYNTLE